MANFTPGPIISEIRGSIGDLTYSRDHSGPVVKSKVQPYPVNRPDQLAWQARVAAAVAAWQALTDAERLEFQTAAQDRSYLLSLGISKKLSGYQLFMRRYLLASKAGEEANLYPLAKKMSGRYELAAIDLQTTGFNIAVRNTGTVASTQFSIFATKPLSPGQLYINPRLLWLIEPAATAPAGLQLIDITAAYEAKYEDVSGLAGQRIAIGLQCFNYETGERTPVYQMNQVVT